MKNYNEINGKQYPYGFRNWLHKLSLEGIKMGYFNKKSFVLDVRKSLDPDSWLNYFMQGLSPIEAIKEDLKEQ